MDTASFACSPRLQVDRGEGGIVPLRSGAVDAQSDQHVVGKAHLGGAMIDGE